MSKKPQDPKKVAQEIERYDGKSSSESEDRLITLPDLIGWLLGFLILWGVYQLAEKFFVADDSDEPSPAVSQPENSPPLNAPPESLMRRFQNGIRGLEKQIYQLVLGKEKR